MTATTGPAPKADTDRVSAALRELLDGRWADVRAETRARLDTPEALPPIGLPIGQHRDHVARQMQRLADSAYPARGFDEAYGGRGDDHGGSVTAFETLGFADLSLLVKAGVQWGLFAGAIQQLGTERHHERYLRRAIDYELPGCFAMTEKGHGSDVQSLRTTATFDPDTDELVIDTPDEAARKDYIGGAARDARVAVVFAQLESLGERHGVHAVMVGLRDEDGSLLPGVSAGDNGHKGGLHGVDNGWLRFDGVRVPRDALLDRFGGLERDGSYASPIEQDSKRFFIMLGALVKGRTSIAGAAVSAAKLALTIAVRYGERRRQFKDPDSGQEIQLLDYLAHQRRLLPRLARTYAFAFCQQELVERLHEVLTGPDDAAGRREVETWAAGVKALGTWHALDTIQTCREACGGIGYMAVNRLVGMHADVDVFTTFEGDNTVLLQLVGKSLLTGYAEEFEALDVPGTIAFVADNVLATIIEQARTRPLLQVIRDVLPTVDPDADVLDRGWQRAVFARRADHVLSSLAQRLKAGMGAEGADPFDVFNHCQDHVLAAARAHVESIIFESLCRAEERCEDPDAGPVLRRLVDLYALSQLEADRAWFLEHGELSGSTSKSLHGVVNDLCSELSDHARALVDAFAIPQALLPPIAKAS
ncbi:MAG: acyl-CoA dehydrogenase family protein [Actinobacteria bacterium]|nr:acyl-CoA dehydrogenase family protein [Actinomycetota bacterium]